MMELKRINAKIEAKSCRALKCKYLPVCSNCEDSANFSVEARTRDWLAEQRKGTVDRSCRDWNKSEENETEEFNNTTVTCKEFTEKESEQNQKVVI